MPIANTNDGSNRPPRLRCYMNLGNLRDLPPWSTGPRASDAPERIYETIRQAGYEGIQGGDPELCRKMGLGTASSARVNKPEEVRDMARKARDQGQECVTIHAAWGLESDAEMDALVGEIVECSAAEGIPLYIETHRATLTDDIWRTVELVKRIPEVRFNGDFSHWYTGHEMRYGDIAAKFDFCQSVFERVRFMHGRIGDPCSMQVDVGDGTQSTAPGAIPADARPWLAHFRDMWTRSMRGFLKSARPGDYLCFAPELLPPAIQYARVFREPAGRATPGNQAGHGEEIRGWREESDRWEQAHVLSRIARECFAAAEKSGVS